MPNRATLTRLLVLASLMGVAGFAAGCGGGTAATGDVDKIQVTLTQFEIAVANTSGGPLQDVVAEIEPVGPASHFVARLDTLSNGETRRLADGNFTDRDAVSFSRRNAKATRITVTGTAMDGKTVRVEVPFKM
jgi:hypothetical protein